MADYIADAAAPGVAAKGKERRARVHRNAVDVITYLLSKERSNA